MIRRVSFSHCGRYVETDRGVLDIASFSVPSSLNLSCPNTIFVTREWLKRDMISLVWFPEEHHATSVATLGEVIVIGHASGMISFIYV